MQNYQNQVRVNHQIRSNQVRLINSDGSNLGVVSLQEALRQAKEQNLDLVEINSKSSPIIVKIIDYGKFKYDEKKKQAEIRKNQKIQELKEITFRPTTDENDLNHKVQAAKEFLADGNKVKFTVRFRGREVTHPEIGKDKLNWVISQLSAIITPNPPIAMEGKFMYVIVVPKK